jgi:enamine deaminase RidA (YjgF/YER057c/UK114 family)
VDVTTFHTDPESQFATIMEVRQRIFTKPPYPNWTAVGVNWLAGFDFEIKVIAYRRAIRFPGFSSFAYRKDGLSHELSFQ